MTTLNLNYNPPVAFGRGRARNTWRAILITSKLASKMASKLAIKKQEVLHWFRTFTPSLRKET